MKIVRIIIMAAVVLLCCTSCGKRCKCETQYIPVTWHVDSVTGITVYQSSMISVTQSEYLGQNKKCSDLDYRKVVDSTDSGYEVESRTCIED